MTASFEKIKVFGEKAREINEGDLFIAIKDSVEGRDVVRLEPIEKKEALKL